MRSFACLLALAMPAQAEDVLDWTPPEAGLVVASRGATAMEGLLDAAEGRFGDVPAVRDAIKRLRAWEVGGVQPGAGEFGSTLKLDRGVAVFVLGPKEGRLVFGADATPSATKRVAEIAASIDAPIRADDNGLVLGNTALTCKQRGRFVVCDTGVVPEAAPGKPPWMDGKRAPTDGVFFGVARGRFFAEMMGGGAPINEVWAAAKVDGGRFVVSAEVVANPLAMAPFAGLLTKGPETAGLETVDARSSGVLKVAFDGPKLLGAVDTMGRREIDRLPPPVRAVWEALRAGWSGSLVVSFPGGLVHPVIVLGLNDDAAGRALMDSIVAAAAGVEEVGLGLGHSATPGVERIEVTIQDGGRGPQTHLGFPFAIHQKRLVLGMHPVDVARVTQGKVQAAKLPASFTARGTHGFIAWDVLGILSMASGFEMWATGDAQLILDAQVLATLGAALLDELGASLTFTETGGRARVWWSWL